MTELILILSIATLAIALYLVKLNSMMMKQPQPLKELVDSWTDDKILSAYKKCGDEPISIAEYIPPKTGHRYIVTGGSGFVGGWIVLHLLARGERPSHIRILDIREPERFDLVTGPAKDVQFIKVDISQADQVNAAFNAPWPIESEDLPPLTVIHTAAVIRFWEVHNFLLERSTKINVEGTRNLIEAACQSGASYLVSTSSIAVVSESLNLLPFPWQSNLDGWCQRLTDDMPMIDVNNRPTNYAWSKALGEKLVREADGRKTSKGQLRTGCLRPGNMIFGPGSDLDIGRCLRMKHSPIWSQNLVQSQVDVENVSLAHLAFERALMAADVKAGGKAFLITNPIPATVGTQMFHALTLLTGGEVTFTNVPPVVILIVTAIVESYYVSREKLLSQFPSFGSIIKTFLPALGKDLTMFQTALIKSTQVHWLIDDSLARRSIDQGGIGYKTPFTTLDGICKLVHGFEESERRDRDIRLGREIAG